MKKITMIVLLLTCTLFIFVGCNTISTNNTEDKVYTVVDKYLNTLQSGDIKDSNQYLTSNFNYADLTFLDGLDAYKKWVSMSSFDITSIKVKDDVAAVSVTFTCPDPSEIRTAHISAISEGGVDVDLGLVSANFLDDEHCPMVTNEIYFALKKVSKEWKIITDINFEYIWTYGTNDELTIETVIENEIKSNKIKEYISEQIQITDCLITVDAKTKLPVVKSISIKNNGDKEFYNLAINIDFLSDSGDIIETRYVKILSLLDGSIMPNNSWKMSKDETIKINNIENAVNPQNTNVYVASIEVMESEQQPAIESEEVQYIKQHLNIVDYKVDTFKSYTGKSVGLSNVALKNNGTRNVSELIITVYFKDSNGKNVAEDSSMIIGSINGGGILKANYSWKMEKDKFYEIENIGDDVNISQHTAEITSITFE